MRSLSPTFLDRLRFDHAAVQVQSEIAEYRGKQALWSDRVPEVLKSLREVAVIESAESSNRIEQVTAPRARIEELMRGTRPRNRSEEEIAGYRDALGLVHESHDSIPFTPGVIRQLHTMLYRYRPGRGGEWKATNNDILEHHPDGTTRVRFRPLAANLVSQAMDDLTQDYARAAENSDYSPLVLVPLVVLDFLCIHPFTDGNGRMSRLLTLLLLYKSGFQVGRYIGLERIVEETKETYYEALQRSSMGWHEDAHDPTPFLRHSWAVLLRAYRELEERVEATVVGNKGERVEAAVLLRLGPFALSDIESDCPNVSREHIRKVLVRMREKGVLELSGHGRGARWRRIG